MIESVTDKKTAIQKNLAVMLETTAQNSILRFLQKSQ